MKVTCANCGEELIGAVNRCWRCGNPVVSSPGSDMAPPVRRTPVEDADAVDAVAAMEAAEAEEADPSEVPMDDGIVFTAEVADGGAAEATVAAASAAQAAPVQQENRPPAAVAPAPASTPATAAPYTRRAASRLDIPRPAYYPKHAAAAGGAVAAMVLAVMSLGFSYFTIGAVFTALLGIGLGAWGVYSNYRGLAVAAMGLCCVAVVLAAVFGAIHLYLEYEGSLPFMRTTADAELEPLE